MERWNTGNDHDSEILGKNVFVGWGSTAQRLSMLFYLSSEKLK
jgi:hypothetical protein